MGIALGSNFTMNAALPLDDRTQVANNTARDAILAGKRYEGLIVYVISEETNYQLVGGITNSDWQELSGTGGSGSSTSGKIAFANNAVTTTALGEYITDAVCLIIDYYLYRRTASGFKSMSGRIFLEAQEDGATNPDKWTLFEAIRSERGGASGVTFSLDDIDTEKSVLVATLDDFTGASHDCQFYYNIQTLTQVGDSSTLTNNSVNTLSTIGEYLVDYRAIIINYYIYRRTDSGYKSMSGKIFLEGQNDGATNPDKWSLFEAERSELGGLSGITFSLDDIDTEKSVLVATLDNFAGANHSCIMYFDLTKLAS